MNTKIDGYKSLLAHITVAQNVQFHKDVAGQIEPLAIKVSGLASSFEAYKTDSAVLDAELDRRNKSIETDELVAKDNRRDATTMEIISRTDYHFKFPQNDAEKEAARILKFIADKYKDAPHKDYQAETSYVRNMVAELRKNADSLELFGLTSLTDRLDKENTEFETLYLTRTTAKEAKRERGTLTELSAKTNNSFDILCQIINGLSLMPFDIDTQANLEKIVSIINGQIHQYTVAYNRHAGVVASKKKGEEETAEETPDSGE
ncbi:MAG: DUF6261 family protein [Bacteroidales bacterium]|jgi:hypothetical protein|nr:DUF6261 family protein [Bacteroidales bacterium]